MKKRFIPPLTIILALLLLAGCADASQYEPQYEPQVRQQVTAMLDGLLAADHDACSALLAEEHPGGDMRATLQSMTDFLSGISSYELEMTNWNQRVINGVSEISVRYTMTAGERKVNVDAAVVSNVEGLTAFYLSPAEDAAAVTVTGTLNSFRSSNALQKVLLAVGLAELLFVLLTAIDCLRRKFRRKWLWLCLIVLGSGLISLTITPNRTHLQFNVGLFLQYTSLLRYSTGDMLLRLYVPVGAILYWFEGRQPPAAPPAPPSEGTAPPAVPEK